MKIHKFQNKHTQKGLSLIEILVVITIFAILGVIVTRAVVLTLQGSKKSESIVLIRENLDYSMNVIERQIRNAKSLTCVSPTQISYKDQLEEVSTFSCSGEQISSGSAVITSNTIKVTGCTFTCDNASSPPSLNVSLTGVSSTATGIQNAEVSVENLIYLRNY